MCTACPAFVLSMSALAFQRFCRFALHAKTKTLGIQADTTVMFPSSHISKWPRRLPTLAVSLPPPTTTTTPSPLESPLAAAHRRLKVSLRFLFRCFCYAAKRSFLQLSCTAAGLGFSELAFQEQQSTFFFSCPFILLSVKFKVCQKLRDAKQCIVVATIDIRTFVL